MKNILLLLVIANISFAQVLSDYKLNNRAINKIDDLTPKGNSISNIFVDNSSGNIWLATSKGLSKSEDNGKTWTNYYNQEPFGKESIISIAVYDGIVWAATGYRDEDGVDVGTGIKFSLDNGDTWKSIPQPLDDPGDSLITYGINTIRALPITVPQQNIIWDLAFTKDYIWIASWAGGVRKANIDELIKNPDMKWERVVLPPDNLDSIDPNDTLNFALQVKRGNFGDEEYLNHVAFSLVTKDSNSIFVGTANGINYSDDGGLSWRKFNHTNQQNPISGNFVVAMGYNEYDNSIWAATWRAESNDEFYSVSASWDLGNTWSNFLFGEKAHNFAFLNNQVIIPTDNGIFRSKDHLEWNNSINIVDHNSGKQIFTTVFYSSAVKQMDDYNLVFIGSAQGLGIIREEKDAEPWVGEWQVIKASENILGDNSTYSAPNPYYPDDTNPLKIVYSTNNQDQKVTIRIFDFGMNLVKTLIQNVNRKGELLEENWNGRDENNNVVKNGVYFYRVDIGDNDPIFNKIVILR